MSSIDPQIPFTYEDYKSLTATSDQRYELIDGEIYVTPAPATTHQLVARNLLLMLTQHVRAHGLGLVLHAPVDVVLGEGKGRNVVQPDILFVRRERTSSVEEAEVVGAPDFIVEVLSPSTADRDLGMKRTLYARSGVREYWIVEPADKRIEAFVLGTRDYGKPAVCEGADCIASAAVPEFVAPLPEVFRRD